MASSPAPPPLCDRCSEPICPGEEVIPTASRRLFHRNCFACSKRHCGRILSLAEYGVHQDQIFCPDCFLSLLKPDLNGNLAINGSGGDKPERNGQEGGGNERPYEHQLRTLQLNEDEEESGEEDSLGGGAEPRAILIELDQPKRGRSTPFGPSPILEADELESQQSQQPSPNPLPSILSPTWRIVSASPKYSPKTTPNGSFGSSILPFRPSNCKRCSGRVYEAEKVVAASEIWHKCCFRCLRCGRSLEPGKFSDRAGEIYCNSCYAKEFGPKGVGCGVGAGILQMHQ